MRGRQASRITIPEHWMPASGPPLGLFKYFERKEMICRRLAAISQDWLAVMMHTNELTVRLEKAFLFLTLACLAAFFYVPLLP